MTPEEEFAKRPGVQKAVQVYEATMKVIPVLAHLPFDVECQVLAACVARCFVGVPADARNRALDIFVTEMRSALSVADSK
jgi:hypothetical protein